MERVSQKNIAERLGVSIATVSLVLSGKEKARNGGRVGEEMSGKIRQLAREMNYEPDNMARGLRTGRSQTIGLIVADISNLFFANLAFHIQEHAEKFDYSVIITNTNESDLKMEKMINVLRSRRVDGFIIVPTEYGKSYITDLINRRIPVVLVDRYFPDVHANSVVVDNYNASREAVGNLIKQGCKRVGLIIYKSSLQHMFERKKGYIDELTEHGCYDPSLVKEVNYSHVSSDVDIAIESLLMRENKVDGIFFATNTLSTLGIKQLMNLNVRIPENVKVVCFDKSEIFDFIDVPVPYIQQPVAEMGKNAVDLIMEQIMQESEIVKNVEIRASLKNIQA